MQDPFPKCLDLLSIYCLKKVAEPAGNGWKRIVKICGSLFWLSLTSRSSGRSRKTQADLALAFVLGVASGFLGWPRAMDGSRAILCCKSFGSGSGRQARPAPWADHGPVRAEYFLCASVGLGLDDAGGGLDCVSRWS